MNIAGILSERTPEWAQQAAICGKREALSFLALEAASARFGGFLRDLGAQPGHTALILCPMSPELYAALIGCFRAGVVPVFLDPSAGRSHMEHCLELMPPQLFVGSPKAHLLRCVSGALRRIPRKIVLGPSVPGASGWNLRSPVGRSIPIEATSPSETAMITFTTGSTGEPKPAARTHQFLLAQHAVLAGTLALAPGQIDLTALPIFVLANLASGVTSVLPDTDLRKPGAIDPLPVIQQIRRWQITSAVASPAFFERLLDSASELSSLQKIFTGGAPVFPSLLDRLAERCPNAKITAVYGSTEAEPIAEIERRNISASDFDQMRKGDGLLAGKPVPEIACRVIHNTSGTPLGPFSSNELEAATMPPGEVGEIVVSGDHVLPGYLHGRGDQETKFLVADRIWHRTGDLGRFDQQGRLWLLGRCSARIQDDLGILYPFTVECAASMFRGVRRSAVVSVKGDRVLALDAKSVPAGLPTALIWAGIDRFELCRIPVDRRHNAKIDYAALLKKLG